MRLRLWFDEEIAPPDVVWQWIRNKDMLDSVLGLNFNDEDIDITISLGDCDDSISVAREMSFLARFKAVIVPITLEQHAESEEVARLIKSAYESWGIINA